MPLPSLPSTICTLMVSCRESPTPSVLHLLSATIDFLLPISSCCPLKIFFFQYVSHELFLPALPFNKKLCLSVCCQVLEFLANPEDESRHEERQQALMELLQAGGLAQFNEGRLLSLAHTARL